MSDVAVPTTQSRVTLIRRPTGLVTWDDVSVEEGFAVPELADGEALARNDLIGMDATVRSWLNAGEGYLPAVEIGETVRAATAGTIVASRCDALQVGDVVASLGGMQQYSICRDDLFTTRFEPGTDQVPLLTYNGANGLTAFVGVLEVGKVQAGDTFVVSAAAGATGSLAGQIAKIAGARVVGIAGTAEKCRFIVEELGFAAAINHRDDDLRSALKEHCPNGVDVYFDNVGGPVLNAVLARIANGARIVLCGAISSYNDEQRPPGPANYQNLISRRGRMEGFIALDQYHRFPEISAQLTAWAADGRLRAVVHEFAGWESAVAALNSLFTGTNTGKVVLRP
jgi:NADPH-dependent curcumin reductase CurA